MNDAGTRIEVGDLTMKRLIAIGAVKQAPLWRRVLWKVTRRG
jgi:hypothetical protein